VAAPDVDPNMRSFHEGNICHRALVLAAFLVPLVAGCVGEADNDKPLSPILIRDRLAGRTFSGSEKGNDFLLHLEPNGIASVNGPTAEFGHWRPAEEGLCLTWHGRPEQCAPVFQIGFSSYRVGDMELISQETFGERSLGGADGGAGHWDFGVPPP
jgi:hypothetical protein